MIITCPPKKPKVSGSHGSDTRRLMYYIAAPGKEEKTLYTGSVNMESPDSDLERQVREMENLAEANLRCKDPVFHAVISFNEGECPTQKQCDEAVRIYMLEHGMENCEAYWGLHQNTDNFHIHVYINRIDPLTYQAAPTYFYKKANERAARKIEIAQGWEIEKTGRYEVIDGEVVEKPRDEIEKDHTLPKGARDTETYTGEKSMIRMVRENANVMDLLFNAKSWQELHEGLFKAGMKIMKKNVGGGVIVIRFPEGEKGIKISSVSQKLSMKKLEAKLGQFVPFEFQQEKQSERDRDPTSDRKNDLHHTEEGEGVSLSPDHNFFPPPPTDNDYRPSAEDENEIPLPETQHEAHMSWTETPLPSYEDYRKEREKFFSDRRQAFADLKTELQKERSDLKATQRKYREEFFIIRKGAYKGQGFVLNALRSIVAEQQIIEREQMMLQQKRRRKDLKELFGNFPSFKAWLLMHGKEEEAQLWRYRESLPGVLTGDGYDLPMPSETEMGNFFARLNRTSRTAVVEYYNQKTQQLAFVDRGTFIRVNQWQSEDALLAAMKLAQQKWGKIAVRGPEEFQRRVIQLAAEQGFTMRDERLQKQVEEIREAKRKEEEEEAKRLKEKQAELFKVYDRALQAERYRVTAIKMDQSGSKKPWVVDKKKGETSIGYTAEELLHNMPKLIGIDKSERNIYYTPLSNEYHYLLIDDMTKESLRQLIAVDGYSPAVQIESSPGNYQVILKVKKLGIEPRIENSLANTLVKQLNEKYGDKNLSGVRHPHRAPGFINLKQKHKREDGTFPEVVLIGTQDVICRKAQNQLNELKEAELKKGRERKTVEIPRSSAIPQTPEDAYKAHAFDIIKRQNVSDFSRLDSMVAVRMVVTGYSYSEIEQAIAAMAPSFRPDSERNKHNWKDYAKRTANYVSRPRGQAAVEKARPYKAYFMNIEGRGIEGRGQYENRKRAEWNRSRDERAHTVADDNT